MTTSDYMGFDATLYYALPEIAQEGTDRRQFLCALADRLKESSLGSTFALPADTFQGVLATFMSTGNEGIRTLAFAVLEAAVSRSKEYLDTLMPFVSMAARLRPDEETTGTGASRRASAYKLAALFAVAPQSQAVHVLYLAKQGLGDPSGIVRRDAANAMTALIKHHEPLADANGLVRLLSAVGICANPAEGWVAAVLDAAKANVTIRVKPTPENRRAIGPDDIEAMTAAIARTPFPHVRDELDKLLQEMREPPLTQERPTHAHVIGVGAQSVVLAVPGSRPLMSREP